MFFKRPYKGGAAVPHLKNMAEVATVIMPVPSLVTIPMLQHIGVNCTPTVQKGDAVYVGQVIGDSDRPMSAPIHSSVSGTVLEIGSMLYPGGFFVPSIEIKTDGLQTLHPSVRKPEWKDRREFLALVRASGLTGLGGAGFPTHVKLDVPAERKVDTLIINAAECEPYITSDYRVMLEKTGYIIAGIRVLREELGFQRVIIGIEDNKPRAIDALRAALAGDEVEIRSLPSRFPQGAEKMLIAGLTGRKVPVGKLPMDVGVVVMNVTSVAFLAEYLETGVPLIKKNVTVDGNVVRNPCNAEVLIGTHLGEVFAFAGGFTDAPCKVIMGGPMMGVAQHSIETSVVKHTNALLAFDKSMGAEDISSHCIRCARCVEACPMRLLPLELGRASIQNRVDDLKSLDLPACIECGSCAYVCPAKIHLVQLMRLGKVLIRNAAVPPAAKKGAV